ncbi:hypothetical protein EVA_08543 [gut metagenome]|uniref:Uncharacterized protein n=1 Tax=gut metagenome TaxID=749906 RepID=J9G913_9ZZZZ
MRRNARQEIPGQRNQTAAPGDGIHKAAQKDERADD